ncbi:MAG TPA: cupin domain-containing protein [Chthonomonadales bacterium]|nr:cupin domain-containing protein [Chthonomonadales bacterium]
MPVVRTALKPLQEGNRPEWCTVTSAGIFRLQGEEVQFDRHYHDFAEYWLIFEGSAKILTEGVEHIVQPGDIVCTQAGEEHDILEIYGDFGAFWFEEPCPAGGRTGHLHRSPEAAAGHPVRRRSLPAPA